MKKTSLSLFALLAIVVAVASAFTIKRVTTYSLYSVQVDQVSTSGSIPTTVSSYDSKLRTNLTSAFSNPIGASETIGDWISSNSSPNNVPGAFCNADASHVCLAKFQEEDAVRDQVLAFSTGDSKQ